MDFGGVQLTLPHDRIHQIPQSNYRPLAQILHEQRAPQNFRDMIRHSPPGTPVPAVWTVLPLDLVLDEARSVAGGERIRVPHPTNAGTLS